MEISMTGREKKKIAGLTVAVAMVAGHNLFQLQNQQGLDELRMHTDTANELSCIA